MSDMIDRQAAIDAVAKALKGTFVEYEDIAEKIINKVPSVQTCGDAVSRQQVIDAICKACSLVGDYHKCDGYPETSTWCDELVALRALPSVQPERWIPCSERLPEKDGEYYVTLENGCVKILGYATVQTLRYPKGFYYVTDDGIAWRQKMNPVIAWMPLPAPYREEGER